MARLVSLLALATALVACAPATRTSLNWDAMTAGTKVANTTYAKALMQPGFY